MMSRGFYVFITTVLFILAYIPTLINTILFSLLSTQPIDFSMIPKNRLKLILLFLICIMESSLIKKEYPGLIGWIITFILFCEYIIRIMHWPGAHEIMFISISLLVVLFSIYAKIEKNKNYYHYLLFGYILMRSILYLTNPNNDYLWLLDVLLGSFIAFAGVFYNIKTLRKQSL